MSIQPSLREDAVPLPFSVTTAENVNDPIAPDIETASEGYARRFSGEVGAYLCERQAAAVGSLLDHIAAAAGGVLSILEVGGGHAQLAGLFLERGHRVTVHGSSVACFKRLQAVHEQYPDRLRCMVASLSTLPAADREYDLVCSIRLLGHMESWREMVAEKCRIAKRFLIAEFAVPEGVQRLSGVLHPVKLRLEPDARPFKAISLSDMEWELERSGFRVVRVVRQFVLPISLHRKLSSPAFSRSAEAFFDHAGLRERLGSPVILLAERVV